MIQQTLLVAQMMGKGSPTSTLLFFVAIFAIMYFLMIRPQQKQLRDQRTLLASLKKGDDVVTQGGLLGRIYALSGKEVTLEIASGVKVRVLLSSVQGRSGLAEGDASNVRAEEKKEEK
jgi:preprotein translocase subunit YajC